LSMEQEEDEDIAFAKWMSSFWGHNLVDEGGKDVRARQRRQSKAPAERRASYNSLMFCECMFCEAL
uniref:Leukemia NUP98 fusion partner 1 n=1 Tax=Callorhinchus milii TaxID=7868 RepID=A0A4W3JUP3_CALMI